MKAAYLHPKYWPTWLGLAFLRVFEPLPHRLLYLLGRGLGLFIHLFPTSFKRIARRNIELALPGLDAPRRRAEDLRGYYRVRMDDRDLNYNKYFTEGDASEAATEDYTSHNTRRLTVKEVESLLLRLPEITGELANWRKRRRRRAR